jgi:hypothetical protein
VPVPTAWLPDHLVHVIWNRNAVESPDSAQPKPPHAGSCSSVPFRSCAAARKVPAPVGAAATLGDEAETLGGVVGPVIGPEVLGVPGGVVGPVIGPEVLAVLGVPAVLSGEEAAELVEELQAVNSTAIHARDAQDATCRGLCAWPPPAAGPAWPPAAAGVSSMMSNPSIQ